MSTPCYYCELDRKENCKWCIHSSFNPEQAIKQARYNGFILGFSESSEGFNGEYGCSKNNLERLAKEKLNYK